MENAGYVSHPCIFHWNIYNPFLPLLGTEATFYSGIPTPIQWKATLVPMFRRNDTWFISFSLSCEEFDEYDIIIALRIQVDISLRGERVAQKEVSNYCFDRGNRHKYEFKTQVHVSPKLEVPCLIIKVGIHLQRPSNTFSSGWFLTGEDQMALSQDLDRLLTDHRYSNMKLLPSNGLPTFQVHSCIIRARWNNFFDFHSLHVTDLDTVETNISEGVLSDILTYMYSGKFSGLEFSNLANISYITELFQVIDRYKLHHLYKVFVKSDSEQLRRTSRALVSNSWDFPLDDVDGKPLDNLSHVRNIDEYAGYNFTFRIEIFMNEEDAWLSYSLKSRSPIGIDAHVNLQFVKKTTRSGIQINDLSPRPESVHNRNYHVGSNETVESGEIRFINSNSIFDDFNTEDRCVPIGDEVQHFIRCNLSLSDGTTVMEVKNVMDNTIQNNRERFGVLSDSMYALLRRRFECDLQINCPVVVPRNLFNPQGKINFKCYYSLHKAIFATRVPEYWKVLQNVPRGSEIPEIVSCTLRNEALHAVLLYIYTGKILTFPLPFLDEISRFAQESGFIALRNLVNRMGYHHTNQ